MPSDLLGVRVEEERDALLKSPPRRRPAPEPTPPSPETHPEETSPAGADYPAPTSDPTTTTNEATDDDPSTSPDPPEEPASPRPADVPEEPAAVPDPVGRATAYDELEASARGGLDPASIEAAASKYSIDERTAHATPLPYDVPNGVRLLCTGIEGPDGGDALRDALAHVCDAVIEALPTGWVTHRNPPRSYHTTVFHTGHPSDPRPPKDPYDLAFEVREATQLVGHTPRIPVIVDRVVMASSGVLLALLTHPGGGESPTDDLRLRCRERWPGAPARQATYVMHVSLCRVLRTTPACDERDWSEVLGRVREASNAVKGKTATLTTVWHVQERTQMTCGDVEAGCVVKRMMLGKDLK